MAHQAYPLLRLTPRLVADFAHLDRLHAQTKLVAEHQAAKIR